MLSFLKSDSIQDFQKLIYQIYGLPDDRLFSVSDLLINQQKFTMRALKGIRKRDINKLKLNILISIAWCMAVANRLHIDIEEAVWKRFPNLCSYCGKKPCACKAIKVAKRVVIKRNNKEMPRTIKEYQVMFGDIYPTSGRSLPDAGIHLAEEMGELSEAVHNYAGEHNLKQFTEIEIEIADYVSCFFGIANSAGINIANELEKMYSRGCHSCHSIPCKCSFSQVATFKS